MSKPKTYKDFWDIIEEKENNIRELQEENKTLREELARMKALKNEYKELVTDKPTEP